MKRMGFGTASAILACFAFLPLRAAANPPRILRFAPNIRYVAEHKAYSFGVVAVGAHRLEYHWWHQEPDSPQGHEIPNEFGVVIGRPRLIVQNALPNRDYNGWYWCVVVDHVTGEMSETPHGQLVVVTAPTITVQPVDDQEPVGGTATFSVEADPGAPIPVTYQWFFGSRPIYGANKATLTLRNLQPQRGGYYSCRVKSMGGITWSGGALLTVTPAQ